MSITIYRCSEPECKHTDRTWPDFLKHMRYEHNSRYNKKTKKWIQMKSLNLFSTTKIL